jgi:hypothetical protein
MVAGLLKFNVVFLRWLDFVHVFASSSENSFDAFIFVFIQREIVSKLALEVIFMIEIQGSTTAVLLLLFPTKKLIGLKRVLIRVNLVERVLLASFKAFLHSLVNHILFDLLIAIVVVAHLFLVGPGHLDRHLLGLP